MWQPPTPGVTEPATGYGVCLMVRASCTAAAHAESCGFCNCFQCQTKWQQQSLALRVSNFKSQPAPPGNIDRLSVSHISLAQFMQHIRRIPCGVGAQDQACVGALASCCCQRSQLVSHVGTAAGSLSLSALIIAAPRSAAANEPQHGRLCQHHVALSQWQWYHGAGSLRAAATTAAGYVTPSASPD